MRVHIAGAPIRFGAYLRQRCSWCGVLIIDQDLSLVARPVEDADTPFPVWPVGEEVAMDGAVTWVLDRTPSLEHEDGWTVSPDCCLRLPVEVTT